MDDGDGSPKVDGSPETDDSLETDGSPETDNSLETDGSLETDDSLEIDGSLETGTSRDRTTRRTQESTARGTRDRPSGGRLPNRRVVEETLDTLVGNNRFTIAVVFPTVGAVTLVASAEGWLPDPLAFNPFLVLFGVFVMRLPIISGLAPLLDRRALAALLVLFAYTYGIEYVGATTGIPYGEFSYEVSLGPMLFGTIPLALALFFVPLVVNSYLLCLLLLGDRARSALVRVPVIAATVVAVDLVLDPAAVALGFWTFEQGGYYGVPPSNYAGWVLSATVATLLIDVAFRRSDLRERVENCPYILDDMVSFVLLWGAVNAFYGAWVPVGIALLFAAVLVRLDRFDFDVRPNRPAVLR